MNISKKAENLIKEYALCNYCLGRQFSNLGTGTTNYERGSTIKLYLIMEISRSKSDDNVNILQLLSRSSSNKAKSLLLKWGITPEDTVTCPICDNKLKNVNELTKIILAKFDDYELNTFLIGTILPKEWFEKERKLKERFDLLQTEYLKQEFNRLIGKKICEQKPLDTDFKNPEIIAEINPLTLTVNPRISSLYIFGRYNKYIRTIPQTRWPCYSCKGKGCEKCKFTGKQYQESVEELIGFEAINTAMSEKVVLHGSGREDIDALMLGSGRPFVLEVVKPRIRTIDLKELERRSNSYTEGKVRVSGYRWSSKKELVYLKEHAQQAVKKYRALIKFDQDISQVQLKKIEVFFIDRKIEQRTPIRVKHRRADLIREKMVYSIRCIIKKEDEMEAIISCDGGCYVKELISGDDGRTLPNISSIAGSLGFCKELDVLEIEERTYYNEI